MTDSYTASTDAHALTDTDNTDEVAHRFTLNELS